VNHDEAIVRDSLVTLWEAVVSQKRTSVNRCARRRKTSQGRERERAGNALGSKRKLEWNRVGKEGGEEN